MASVRLIGINLRQVWLDQELLHGGLYGGRRKTVSNEKFINIVLATDYNLYNFKVDM